MSGGGGGSARSYGPGDDDVGSYVGSERAELQMPPLQDHTEVQSLDETGMTKGRRLQLPSSAFVHGGRGRRGTRGRGRHDSPDRVRVNTRDHDDHERRDPRNVEDRHLNPPSTKLISQRRCQLVGPIDFQDPICGRKSAVPLGGLAYGTISSVTPASYGKERFRYEMVGERRVQLDLSGHVLPHEFLFAGPQSKISGLPYLDEGFIYCEANALALAQAVVNASLADQRVLLGFYPKDM
ncbi:hypothetical protein Dimus_002840 [Dionaea muscipula]